jgi:putative transposase
MHTHLRRLDRIWIPHAVYFITVCTHDRKPILATPQASDILRTEWSTASTRHGWRIGRYVIMPDHVHFFCAEQPDGAKRNLSSFIGMWKQWAAKSLIKLNSASLPVWQKQFFDHVLRHDESYAEKWQYVRHNPVRAGLAAAWQDWPYRGYVDFDEPQ